MTKSFVEHVLNAQVKSKPVVAKTLYHIKLTPEEEKKAEAASLVLSDIFAKSTMRVEYSKQIEQERVKRVRPHINIAKIRENYLNQNTFY